MGEHIYTGTDLTKREHEFCNALCGIDERIGRWAAARLRNGVTIEGIRARLRELAEATGRT